MSLRARQSKAEQRRVLSGYVMTDSNIKTAVAAWLRIETNDVGHISTWDTSGVTDMSMELRAFEERSVVLQRDIGAWDTSSPRDAGDVHYAPRPSTRTSVIGRSTASRTWTRCSTAPRPSTRTSAGAWTTT